MSLRKEDIDNLFKVPAKVDIAEITKAISTSENTKDYIQEIFNKAVSVGNADIAKAMMTKGAEIDIKDDPLHLACARGHLDIVKLLLESLKEKEILSNIFINAKDNTWKTPFHYACLEGHSEIAELLLKEGATIDIPSKQTLLQQACSRGHSEIAKLLLDTGAEIDIPSKQTLLQQACSAGHIKMVGLLLEKGAGINTQDKLGKTPLYRACSAGRPDIVELLLKNGAQADENMLEHICANPAINKKLILPIFIENYVKRNSDFKTNLLKNVISINGIKPEERETKSQLVISMLKKGFTLPKPKKGDLKDALDSVRNYVKEVISNEIIKIDKLNIDYIAKILIPEGDQQKEFKGKQGLKEAVEKYNKTKNPDMLNHIFDVVVGFFWKDYKNHNIRKHATNIAKIMSDHITQDRLVPVSRKKNRIVKVSDPIVTPEKAKEPTQYAKEVKVPTSDIIIISEAKNVVQSTKETATPTKLLAPVPRKRSLKGKTQ